MFNMTTSSHLFRTKTELKADGWELEGNVFVKGDEQFLPFYEAKLMHQFTHRWGTYLDSGKVEAPELQDLRDANYAVMPRYWVREACVEARLENLKWPHRWLMGCRLVTRATDERTFIASFMPVVSSVSTA